MVVCLERGVDLHMAQLMPLPLTVSYFSKIQIGFTFWYRLNRVVLEKGPLNECVCVCVCDLQCDGMQLYATLTIANWYIITQNSGQTLCIHRRLSLPSYYYN